LGSRTIEQLHNMLMSGLSKLMFAGGNPQLLVETATMSLPILMCGIMLL
jgi:hypothetical protein